MRQARAIAGALVDDELPIAEYPGVILNDSEETLRKKVEDDLIEPIVEALTRR